MDTIGPLHPAIRWTAGLLSIVAALIGIPLAVLSIMAWATWPPWPALGAAGAIGAMFVLKTVSGSGRRPSGPRLAILLFACVFVPVGMIRSFSGYQRSFERGYLDTMRSDLRNLASAESEHREKHGRFTVDVTALKYKTSSSVAVTIERADSVGWRASATHTATERVCSVSVVREAPIDSIPCTN